MAIFPARAARQAEALSEEAFDKLSRQINLLRKELASVSASVDDYGGNTLESVQHSALAIAREVGHGSKDIARQVSHQAKRAGKAVQSDPLPVVVALGTIALLSALLFSRD
jgi:hypothetical protein